jgi:RNA polymerase sigma-70 factor (ECF subfamily)
VGPTPSEQDRADRKRRFEQLFQAYYEPVLGYALRRVEQPADAADILAEVFLVAWRRIDDVPPGADARPWLYGVARRTLSTSKRGRRRRDRLGDRLRTHLTETAPAADHLDWEASAQVRAALRRLSDDDRELLTLVGWEGLAPVEIATVFDLEPGVVRVRLLRARRRLRRELAMEADMKRLIVDGHVGDERAIARLVTEDPR